MGPLDLPEEVRESLFRVLAYMWKDECEDARENGLEGHIFEDMVRVDNWLEGYDVKPEDYLRD